MEAHFGQLLIFSTDFADTIIEPFTRAPENMSLKMLRQMVIVHPIAGKALELGALITEPPSKRRDDHADHYRSNMASRGGNTTSKRIYPDLDLEMLMTGIFSLHELVKTLEKRWGRDAIPATCLELEYEKHYR